MTNPEKILRELDRHLHQPVSLILYGRGALSLAFPGLGAWESTMDVDVIIPTIEVDAFDQNFDFWDAVTRTNENLAAEGLYITHVFLEEQVILSKEWRNHCAPIFLPELKHLSISRPSTKDLILTKMMRIDPQDRDDIRELLAYAPRQENWVEIFDSATMPDIPEIKEAFRKNTEWFLEEFS